MFLLVDHMAHLPEGFAIPFNLRLAVRRLVTERGGGADLLRDLEGLIKLVFLARVPMSRPGEGCLPDPPSAR